MKVNVEKCGGSERSNFCETFRDASRVGVVL